MSKIKKKKICIDADFVLFACAEGSYVKDNQFANEKVKLAPYKERFKAIIHDIVEEAAAEYLGVIKIKGEPKVLLGDPDGNFRYEIYPEYKGNRKSSARSDLFYRLRKWALKEYGYVKGVEADDVYGYLVGVKGYLGCSFDKDCLKGIAGSHFDTYHTRRFTIETSITDALNFNYLQTLMGDRVDNIKGLPRVGEATARKLLDEHGWSWDGVLKAYESKGLGKKDMLLNARLVLLTQWTPKKGVKLWKP